MNETLGAEPRAGKAYRAAEGGAARTAGRSAVHSQVDPSAGASQVHCGIAILG